MGVARALFDLTLERRLRQKLLARHPGLKLGLRVEVRSPERLHLGQRVTIDSGALLHCGGMEWSQGRGAIWIGDDTYIGPNAVLFGAGEIKIGAQVLVSPGVVITSHQHSFQEPDRPLREQPSEFSPVVIEDNVWIGSNATVLPAVTIGAGSVIGAGAVLTRSVPPRSLALGVPARVVRTL